MAIATQEPLNAEPGQDFLPGDVVAEAERLFGLAIQNGVTIKVLGGLGCWLHVREHGQAAERYRRTYGDIDVIIPRSASRSIEKLMKLAAYEPMASFNAVQGETRQMFVGGDAGTRVDVFIGDFVMCHRIAMRDDAFKPPEHPSLGLVELLLTKLQVVRFSPKDLQDSASLLAFHGLGKGAQEINADRLAGLLAQDWGLYRTTTGNLEQIGKKAAEAGDQDLARRVSELVQEIEAKPKSLGWRIREKVGERVPWYEEPEEPETLPEEIR